MLKTNLFAESVNKNQVVQIGLHNLFIVEKTLTNNFIILNKVTGHLYNDFTEKSLNKTEMFEYCNFKTI